MPISPEILSGLAGVILSLLVSYIPGLAPWYDQLTPTPKKLLMLVLLLLAALGSLLYQCRADVACVGVEWERYLGAFIAALVANQSTANITPLSAKRRAARAVAATENMPPAVKAEAQIAKAAKE